MSTNEVLKQNYKNIANYACDECKKILLSNQRRNYSLIQCLDCEVLTGKNFHENIPAA